MTIKQLLAPIAIAAILFNGCSKDENNEAEKGVSVLSVRLTDAPAAYDAVYVDIIGVEIKSDNGSTTNLNVSNGIYNLLDFTNGTDTMIATGLINSGTVSQIRLILGENNSLVVDGVTHPLSTPSAQQSGLKLQVHKTFAPGIAYMLLLDFDAHQSIVEQGNGQYQLKPVVRVIDSAISGSIKGSILPAGVNCVVTATSSGISYSTSTVSSGQFLIPGVPPGIYDITIIPVVPHNPVNINAVSVVVGGVADIGTITL